MPARIGDASEDTLQAVGEKLDELLADTPQAVTGLPSAVASPEGMPVYVVDGLIQVEEPVDVNLRDLRPDDPVEENARGLPIRFVPAGAVYEILDKLGRAIGPNVLADAMTVRFAIDALPDPNPTGAPASAASGVINDGQTLLFTLGATFTGTGAGRYLQLHNAAEATTLDDSTMTGWTYPLDQLNLRWQLNFGALAPLKFALGCRWAMSSTENTYTASAETAIVRWIARAVT